MTLPGFLIVFVLFLAAAFGIQACSASLANEDSGQRLLETQGFSNVQYQDRDWMFVGVRGCHRDDTVIINYAAVNPAGRQVKVSVCQGWPFAGPTIRGIN